MELSYEPLSLHSGCTRNGCPADPDAPAPDTPDTGLPDPNPPAPMPEDSQLADSIAPALLSLAMGFVPRQTWETPYAPDVALSRGTIFPALDLPLLGEPVLRPQPRTETEGWQ